MTRGGCKDFLPCNRFWFPGQPCRLREKAARRAGWGYSLRFHHIATCSNGAHHRRRRDRLRRARRPRRRRAVSPAAGLLRVANRLADGAALDRRARVRERDRAVESHEVGPRPAKRPTGLAHPVAHFEAQLRALFDGAAGGGRESTWAEQDPLSRSNFPIVTLASHIVTPLSLLTGLECGKGWSMGRTISVECGDCGYAGNGLTVGTGTTRSREDEVWPCACAGCRQIVSSQVNRTPVVCAKCGSSDVTPLGRVAPWRPVDATSLAEMTRQRRSGRLGWTRVAERSRELLRSGERVICDEPYRCPRCGALGLRPAI